MPAYDFIPQANYQDFERMLCSLFAEIHNVPFQRWGRDGQQQDGIDVAGQLPDGTYLLIQAKLRRQSLKARLSIIEVQEECTKAESFRSRVSRLVVVTTAPNDAKLQGDTAQLSAQRVEDGKFPVAVWGWGNVSDEINRCKKTREAFYPTSSAPQMHWTRIAALIAFTVGAITLAVVGVTKMKETERGRQEAAKQLEDFFVVADAVKAAHNQCIEHLNSSIFSYSVDLSAACIDNLESKIANAESRVRALGTTLVADAWTETKSAVEQMRTDYYQAAVAYNITKRFEDDYVQLMHSFCFKNKELQQSQMERLQEAANEAMIAQLQYYFVLSDFIIPAFDSIDARLTYRARQLVGEEVPANVISRANRLVSLMQERTSYKFEPPKVPFSLSAIKQYSSRNIKMNGDSNLDEVEKARRMQVIFGAMEEAFIGRKGDVEALIRCGVLKSSAMDLIKPVNRPEFSR